MITCGNSLFKKDVADIEIEYGDARKGYEIAGVDKLLFTNVKSEACPITGCEMKKSGCSSAYDGKYLNSTQSPFGLKV